MPPIRTRTTRQTRELGLGLDPTNPDIDGDGVAGGDEINIYGTDPLDWDDVSA